MGEGQLKDMSRVSTDRKSKPTLMRTTLHPHQVVYKVFLNPLIVLNQMTFRHRLKYKYRFLYLGSRRLLPVWLRT